MACGVNFKYNYFIKEETWPSCDIIWRSGPEFSISVPLPVQQDKRIMVRDSWMRFDTKRPPAHVWDSWIEETYLPIKSLISAPARGNFSICVHLICNFFPYNVSEHSNASSGLTDEDEIVKSLESNSIESKPFLHDSMVKDILCSKREDTTSATHNGSNSDRVFTEKDQPVEEPWLLPLPLIFPVSKDKMGSDASKSNDTLEDEVIKMEDKGNLLPEEGSNLISEEPISTVIMINSSICTMQRIAVLEDGKLVELLLEPVKNNVQCDSVYLGVVTKLVPHMGGAFVNIGNSRHSLMDIKQNREPFIFPPFRRRTKKREINGSVTGPLEKHLTAHDNECTSHDIIVNSDNTEVDSRDDPVQSMHNDYEEHEAEDDFDISVVLEENVNGGIIDYDEAEADFEDCIDRSEHHLEGETINHALPVDIDGSNDSQMSHPQHMKDSRHTFNNDNKWAQVRKGTKIVVQVVKEGLGTKGPTLTAYPKLRSRFWV